MWYDINIETWLREMTKWRWHGVRQTHGCRSLRPPLPSRSPGSPWLSRSSRSSGLSWAWGQSNTRVLRFSWSWSSKIMEKSSDKGAVEHMDIIHWREHLCLELVEVWTDYWADKVDFHLLGSIWILSHWCWWYIYLKLLAKGSVFIFLPNLVLKSTIMAIDILV